MNEVRFTAQVGESVVFRSRGNSHLVRVLKVSQGRLANGCRADDLGYEAIFDRNRVFGDTDGNGGRTRARGRRSMLASRSRVTARTWVCRSMSYARSSFKGGWVISGEYVDEGVTGSAKSRPALDRLMQAVENREVDAVLVWRFDRFARSTQHLLGALEDFRRVGVDFITVRECVDTSTASGKMVFTFLAAVVEFERALIRERVTAGVSRAWANGKHCGRPRRDLDLDLAHLLLG